MATEYTYTLNEFLKDQIPELVGVVRSVALRELRLTLREFFEKTYAWTVDIKDIAIPTGETGIQVTDDDDNTVVIGILNVARGNPTEKYRDLSPLPARPIGEQTASRNEAWYISSNPDEITLYPYQDIATTDDLTVNAALIPAFDVDPAELTVPRQVLLKYYDAIEEGFLARMYGQPNKPYSAPALAMQKRHNFVRAIGFYIAQRKGGYNGAPNWNYPRGWKVARSR